MKDIFIVHQSVLHDAFREDYETPYRDSSKEFLQLLLKHKVEYGKKIACTSGEIFMKIKDSPIGNTKTIWIIPEHMIDVDFSTSLKDIQTIKLDQSIVELASKKCIESTPFIVSTKPENKIDLEGCNFTIITPREAIKMYHAEGSNFK